MQNQGFFFKREELLPIESQSKGVAKGPFRSWSGQAAMGYAGLTDPDAVLRGQEATNPTFSEISSQTIPTTSSFLIL